MTRDAASYKTQTQSANEAFVDQGEGRGDRNAQTSYTTSRIQQRTIHADHLLTIVLWPRINAYRLVPSLPDRLVWFSSITGQANFPRRWQI